MCEFSVPELNGCDFNCSGHSVLELNKKGETRVTYGASLIYLLREEPRDPGALVPKERKQKRVTPRGPQMRDARYLRLVAHIIMRDAP
jgi:hypothetical protein